MQSDFYTAKEMAKILGVSYVNLTKWVKDPDYNVPPHIIVGKNTIKFSKKAYEEWKKQETENASS